MLEDGVSLCSLTGSLKLKLVALPQNRLAKRVNVLGPLAAPGPLMHAPHHGGPVSMDEGGKTAKRMGLATAGSPPRLGECASVRT